MQIPNKVYKYRNFSEPNHLKIITDQEVYFARPIEFYFNDDCKIKLDKDYIMDEENMRKYYRRQYLKNYGYALETYDPRITRYMNTNKPDEEDIIYSEDILELYINLLFGVFCVSLNGESDYLWSTFSNNYQGFCVEFELKNCITTKIATQGFINYIPKEDLPKAKMYGISENEMLEYFNEFIFQLPNTLVYEEEYRFFKYIHRVKDRKFIIPKQNITGIILGNEISASNEKLLRELSNTHLPNTRVYKLN